MPSGPRALSGEASCMALSTSCSVMGGIIIRSGYVASSMSPVSASGGEGKNTLLKVSAFSAGPETISEVSGCSSIESVSQQIQAFHTALYTPVQKVPFRGDSGPGPEAAVPVSRQRADLTGFANAVTWSPAHTQTTNTTRRPLRRPKYPLIPPPNLTLNDGSLMARSQNRKRQRADEPSRADIDPPAKKTKTRAEIELEAWESFEYPPEFWDRLSKISLTHRALKELDRRNRTRRCHPSSPSPPASPSRRVLSRATTAQELAQFARHGGPDLRDLRGYPHPPMDHQQPVAMSASQSSRGRMTKSADPASTVPTTTTTKTKKSTVYNRDFDLHLTEHLVHPVYSSQEPDLEEVRAAVAVPRPSLSPTQFSDGAFKAFRASDARAKDEDDVLANVIPTILGPSRASRFCARNTLARSARNELAGHIIPSTMLDKPMAPNFFMEVKGPDGKPSVATRQARYHGAFGSRAMHSLQNYGAEEAEYDGKAYTFSSTYQDGTLKLYAHHVTAPTTEGGRPEYHMTYLSSYAITGNRDRAAEGIGALRNTLDLADQYRGNFIRVANGRAPQAEAAARQERATVETQSPEDSTDELAPSLRPYTTQIQHEEESPDELALTPPGYLYEGDDSQDPQGVGPPTSLTTSFASSFGPYQSRPKRQRSPRSDAVEGQTSKIRSRNTREAESSTTTTGPVVSGTVGSFQVRTYWKKGKLCFLNLREQEIETETRDWMEQALDDGSKCFYWRSPKSGRVFWTTALPADPE
ncbi:hypothetical protein B0T21DRAFT_351541 [Apiosordaria backusii]|uniref:DUF7924 domain-containing protein n=1 Tax=Apiosordaria backusii TaxID=314023 RepID=A0AA40AMT3_9PEZI|nr:hypothetical protein B0T21DRAFT_351541 [Apiosordaria backusii]